MRRYLWVLWIIPILAVWLGWFFQRPILRSLGIYWWPETVGQWGDSFGALNALFAAFAFLGVLGTLAMQQRQIRDAAKETHRQKFDDVFFRLIALLREARSEVRYTPLTSNSPREHQGPKALRSALGDAEYYLLDKRPLERPLRAIEIANIYANNVHKRGEAGLGPYFRLIYTVLRRVHDDPHLSEAEKISYGNLLRGQLGSPEIGLLALNGLTKDSKNLSDYIHQFRMLKYLPAGITKRAIEAFYGPEAFQARDD